MADRWCARGVVVARIILRARAGQSQRTGHFELAARISDRQASSASTASPTASAEQRREVQRTRRGLRWALVAFAGQHDLSRTAR